MLFLVGAEECVAASRADSLLLPIAVLFSFPDLAFVSGLQDSPVGGTLLITPGFNLISAAVNARLLPPAVEAVLELLAELTDVVDAVEA